MTFPLAQLADEYRRDNERWVARRESVHEARVARRGKKRLAAPQASQL